MSRPGTSVKAREPVTVASLSETLAMREDLINNLKLMRREVVQRLLRVGGGHWRVLWRLWRATLGGGPYSSLVGQRGVSTTWHRPERIVQAAAPLTAALDSDTA